MRTLYIYFLMYFWRGVLPFCLFTSRLRAHDPRLLLLRGDRGQRGGHRRARAPGGEGPGAAVGRRAHPPQAGIEEVGGEAGEVGGGGGMEMGGEGPDLAGPFRGSQDLSTWWK